MYSCHSLEEKNENPHDNHSQTGQNNGNVECRIRLQKINDWVAYLVAMSKDGYLFYSGSFYVDI